MRRLRQAFLSFLNKVPFYGLSIVCGDDPHLRLMLGRITRRKVTYGFANHNTYQITSYLPKDGGSECTVKFTGREGASLETLKLRVPGKHNVLNALATLAVADELSIPREQTLRGLWAFQGVQRRFQNRGEHSGVTFIDDYAHHPSEISATLAAARERYPSSKIRVVFQPHRYSRVEDLFDRFSACFGQCDAIAVTDIYAAGESPIPGVHSQVLVENIRRHGPVDARYSEGPMLAVEEWLKESAPGDIILTLGAGDLPNVYKQLF